MTMISELLAQNAQLYPHDIALVELKPSKEMRNELTWKELDDRANRVANALMARGIGKGDKVIHWMMNCLSWLEIYFGIIRMGAWSVPLNFRFTSKDLKYCADIAEAKTMFLGQEFIERVEAIRSQLATIQHYVLVGDGVSENMDKYHDMLDAASSEPINIKLGGEDACGLYFTSGTTGDPKPILLTHSNMACAAVVEQAHHFQTREDNFTQLSLKDK